MAALAGAFNCSSDGWLAQWLAVKSEGNPFFATELLRFAKDNDWLGKGQLCDSLVIKFYQNYYFVNFRSGDQWVLRLLRQKASGSIEFMSIPVSDDAKRKEILKKLSRKFEVKELKRKDDTFYGINPTREQLMGLIKEGFFEGSELSKVK